MKDLCDQMLIAAKAAANGNPEIFESIGNEIMKTGKSKEEATKILVDVHSGIYGTGNFEGVVVSAWANACQMTTDQMLALKDSDAEVENDTQPKSIEVKLEINIPNVPHQFHDELSEMVNETLTRAVNTIEEESDAIASRYGFRQAKIPRKLQPLIAKLLQNAPEELKPLLTRAAIFAAEKAAERHAAECDACKQQ